MLHTHAEEIFCLFQSRKTLATSGKVSVSITQAITEVDHVTTILMATTSSLFCRHGIGLEISILLA